MMSRVGKTEGAGALHRGILEARLEKRAILPNFNVDIRDPKFLIGLRLTESNLRFRNFGFEMGFCPISQFPPAGYSSMLLPSARRGIPFPLSLDIVGSTWFKELYIRDYGGFRLNKVGCSEPPEAPSPPVPWPDCRRFQLRFADEPVSSCSSAGHGLCGGQPQRVRHEGKTCLLRPGGHWTGRV